MKLSKFLLFATCITFFAVLYVYQQTEVFRLAYMGQKKSAVFQVLLDKNTILRYNKARNASLINIANRVSKGGDFQMPETYRLVRLTSAKRVTAKNRTPKKQNLITRFFSIKRQAEAKTIGPSNSLPSTSLGYLKER
jgi:hypothetical protein